MSQNDQLVAVLNTTERDQFHTKLQSAHDGMSD